ncbi:MAG: hypothetical protein ACLUD0_04800 [Eubacterium ramulus]
MAAEKILQQWNMPCAVAVMLLATVHAGSLEGGTVSKARVGTSADR